VITLKKKGRPWEERLSKKRVEKRVYRWQNMKLSIGKGSLRAEK